MKFAFVPLLALGLSWGVPAGAETAVTVKATELKQEPYSDATTLATLPGQTSVEVLKRQGGWTQVKPPSVSQGWVRMLSLRFGDGSAKQGDSGLGSLFNVARTGSSGTTVTTGVKGLDITKDTVQNARPNMNELKRMHGYTVGKGEALKLAGSANLHKQSVEYLGAGSSRSSESSSSSWGNN